MPGPVERWLDGGEGGARRLAGRTQESEMMVLRPAVILGSGKGTLLVVSGGQAALFMRCLPRYSVFGSLLWYRDVVVELFAISGRS